VWDAGYNDFLTDVDISGLPLPPTATTSPATYVGDDVATLNGIVNPHSASTTVRFVWGTTSGVYTDSASAAESPLTGSSNQSVSKQLTSLTETTTYYYRVRAYNANGTAQGSELNFTTLTGGVTGNVYHVATTGSNSNSGLDSVHAWTLERAIDVTGTPHPVAGDTVWVHGGTYNTYREWTPVWNCTISGADGNPIVIRNYRNQAAIISQNIGRPVCTLRGLCVALGDRVQLNGLCSQQWLCVECDWC